MEILYNTLIVISMAVLAVIAGIFEDLESDVASTSNPNSQVQLAPQLNNLHKFFNRAISGEPLLVATTSTISATISYVLLAYNISAIYAILFATLLTTILLAVLSVNAYMARITSQALYNQPLFVDVIRKHLPVQMAHAFIYIFSLTLLSYIVTYVLANQVLTLPVVALLMGITLGSVASAVGDIHYGAENLYQSLDFGSGIPVSSNGQIDTMEVLGAKNSIDVAYFCSKFAGPITGLTFALIIFVSFYFNLLLSPQNAIILLIVLTLLLVAVNYSLEKYSRSKYSEYGERNDD